MSWVRYDDRFDDVDKVQAAWERDRATIGLHVMATTFCARHDTDGVVSNRWLRQKLPTARERNRVLAIMLEERLFDLLTAGEIREIQPKRGEIVTVGPFAEDVYLVHDYLQHNDSSRYLGERRRRDSERKRSADSSDSVQSESNGNPRGFLQESSRNPIGPHARAAVQVGSGRDVAALRVA